MNGSTLIQGGRLRKTSRGIISFAPFLVGASVLALGALLATTSPTEAGSCDVTTPNPTLTTRVCSDPAKADDDAVSFTLGHDGRDTDPKSVTFTDRGEAFGLDVTGDDGDGGFLILGAATSEGVTISLSGEGDITVDGTDDATAADLFTKNGDAIFIQNAGIGDTEVNTIANLQSKHGSGVQIRSINTGLLTEAAHTTVNVTGNIGAAGKDGANHVGKDGIYIFQNKAGGGNVSVSVTGDIWAGRAEKFTLDRAGETMNERRGRGIYVIQEHASGGHADVIIEGDSGSSGSISSRGSGIIVDNAGIGRTSVTALDGDISVFGGGHGIYAKTNFVSKNYGATIAAKTVLTKENRAVELFHRGGGAGRIAVTGTAASEGAEAIFITAFANSMGGLSESPTPMDAYATHLSVKVGTEEQRTGGAASADNVTSTKDGITIDHNGGAMATADVRSYTRIEATNTEDDTDATGIKIIMGRNTGNADIVQEDGTGTKTRTGGDGATTTTITGVTVRAIAREEINAKTHGIHINQGGTGNVRIESSCSVDTITTADSCITTAGGEGIRVNNLQRMNDMDVELGTTGRIQITVDGEADRGGNTGTDRAIKSQGTGIFLHQVGDGDADITVNGSIETTMGYGVQIDRDNGNGDATIMVNADITAGGDSGAGNGRSAINVHFIHDPSNSITTGGDVDVTIAEGVTITGDHAPAVDVGNFGSGSLTVDINGTIRRTGSAGIVLNLGNGRSSGDLRLVLRDGAVVEDGRATSNRDIEVLGTATATVELTGAREDKTLDLGDISGFDDLEKTGSGTWTLTGAQDPDGTNHANFALNQLTVDAGTLVVDLDSSDGSETPALKFRKSGSMPDPKITIAQGASLRINEDISLEGVNSDTSEEINVILELNDNLFLSGADGRFDVGSLDAGAGASLTIEVEFPEVMEEMDGTGGMDETGGMEGEEGMEEEEGIVLDEARFDTGSGDANVEEAITVNIIPINGGATPTTIGNLIRVGGDASLQGGTFVASNAIDSPFRFTLEHEQEDGGADFWNLISEQVASTAAGGSGAIHDTFTAVLSELSQLETLHERLRDRKAKYGTSSWVKTYAGNTEFTPSATSFDIEQAGFEMGLRAPLRNVFDQNWAEGLSFDASIEFARAFTDVLVEMGMVDIQTDTFGVGVGTTYNLGGLYIDGQLRYSQFENNIDNESMRLASPGASSLAAGIEIGHVLGGDVSLGDFMGGTDVPGDAGSPDIKLIPSAQLLWSSVDFDPYTSETGVPVRLDDGDVLFGRIGALAEGEWKNVHFLHESFPVADVRLRGHLNLLMPLEGEVVTEIMGVPMASERIEPALDMGIGFAYEWDDAYALHAGFTTQQGEEVEGYTGNIGFKHEF